MLRKLKLIFWIGCLFGAFSTLPSLGQAGIEGLNSSQLKELVNQQDQPATPSIPPADTLPRPAIQSAPDSQPASRIERLYLNLENHEEFRFQAAGITQNVQSSSGLIAQYGYSVFKNSPATTAFAATDLPVGNDYILGIGDELSITMWGKIEESFRTTIDKNGQIYLPKAGFISITGLTLETAQNRIKEALTRHYINIDIQVTVSKTRSMKIFILGQVEQPGAYEVSSFATALNALYIAGGPTKMGTLRNIQIKRNGKTIHTIDLYRLLLNGDQSSDIQLKASDTIFVGPIGSTAKIKGSVKQEGIFEIQTGTSVFAGLYWMAGGPLNIEKSYMVHINRQAQTSTINRHIITISLQDTQRLKNTAIQDGDILTLTTNQATAVNQVTVKGALYNPGNFKAQPNMTLVQAIETAGGLKPGAYIDQVHVYRFISDFEREVLQYNLANPTDREAQIKPRDIIQVYSKYDVFGDRTVFIEGAVEAEGEYKLLGNMTLLDALFLAKIQTTADLTEAELFRQSPGQKPQVITLDLQTALQNPSSPSNIALQDQDRILIRQDEKNRNIRRITLTGQVRFPGVYYATKNETLSDIILRAGGFTDEAFPQGMIFTRESIKDKEAENRQKILEEERKRLIYYQPPLAYQTEARQEIYKDALTFVENTVARNNGRVIIPYENFEKFQNSKDDIPIENGDQLTVPRIPDTIQILGGVNQPSAIVFQPDKDLRYYINQVGGYTEFANKNKVLILKANGKVQKENGLIERGDSIYVGETVKVQTDWLNVFSKVATILGGFAQVIFVLGNI